MIETIITIVAVAFFVYLAFENYRLKAKAKRLADENNKLKAMVFATDPKVTNVLDKLRQATSHRIAAHDAKEAVTDSASSRTLADTTGKALMHIEQHDKSMSPQTYVVTSIVHDGVEYVEDSLDQE